jgi:hypothetical protein
MLCYVDDVLCMSHNPEKSMKRIQDDFKLKDDKMEPPDVCLGASASKLKLARVRLVGPCCPNYM